MRTGVFVVAALGLVLPAGLLRGEGDIEKVVPLVKHRGESAPPPEDDPRFARPPVYPKTPARPDNAGAVLRVTLGAADGLGFGWQFADGPELLLGLGRGRVALAGSTTLAETEFTRWSLLTGGGPPALRFEGYLGHGVALEGIGSAAGLGSRVGVRWFPFEGLDLALAFDPLLGDWDLDFGLAFGNRPAERVK